MTKNTNNKGVFDYFHSGDPNHWSNKCPQISEVERAGVHMTKGNVLRVHTQVSEVIQDHEDSEYGIIMLVKQKYKQFEKLHPNWIYLDNCSTYNQK